MFRASAVGRGSSDFFAPLYRSLSFLHRQHRQFPEDSRRTSSLGAGTAAARQPRRDHAELDVPFRSSSTFHPFTRRRVRINYETRSTLPASLQIEIQIVDGKFVSLEEKSSMSNSFVGEKQIDRRLGSSLGRDERRMPRRDDVDRRERLSRNAGNVSPQASILFGMQIESFRSV